MQLDEQFGIGHESLQQRVRTIDDLSAIAQYQPCGLKAPKPANSWCGRQAANDDEVHRGRRALPLKQSSGSGRLVFHPGVGTP